MRACISVHRRTHRAYFMEVARAHDGSWTYAAPFDNCCSCHAGGPRVIRPLDKPQVDRRTLDSFNRRILSYGPCDPGDALDPTLRGEPTDDTRCAPCHNDILRPRLYALQSRAIHFKTTRDHTMPP